MDEVDSPASLPHGQITGVLDPSFKFRGLRTSPPDPTYNCVAWAFGRNDRFWWPDGFDPITWPIDLVGTGYMITEFENLFQQWNWYACDSDAHERDFNKIALFVDADNVPTHLARMLVDDTHGAENKGLWTSKLRSDIDVIHSLDALAGTSLYGTVKTIYRKRISSDLGGQVTRPD